jgi:DNA-binding LytR/AlgR family response regulator
MITALIVDDEKLARDELRYLLGKHDDVRVLGEAANVQEALACVANEVPDLVLLDIQMPGATGFELVERLSEQERTPQVIFVTAYDEYAVRAFEISATDYLLKPVDEERLAESLERVRRSAGADTASREELLRLLRQLGEEASKGRQTRPPRLSVRKGDRYILVDPSEVTHAYIVEGVVFVATPRFTGMTAHRTLDDLENDLDPHAFRRVHRSYIVNINHVSEVIPGPNGTYRLRCDDEKKTVVPLSRAQAKQLRKLLRW